MCRQRTCVRIDAGMKDPRTRRGRGTRPFTYFDGPPPGAQEVIIYQNFNRFLNAVRLCFLRTITSLRVGRKNNSKCLKFLSALAMLNSQTSYQSATEFVATLLNELEKVDSVIHNFFIYFSVQR